MSTKTDFQSFSQVDGDSNIAVSGHFEAGQGIHITNIRNVQGTEEPRNIQLSGYQGTQYLEPLFTEQALAQLKKKRLIVLHGNRQFRKGAFIKQLAWRLWQEDPGLACMEFLPSAERGFHIQKKLLDATRPSIIMMEQTQATDMPGSPSEIRRLAGSQHFVITWTDYEPDKWALEEHEQNGLFLPVPEHVEYPSEGLEQLLLQQLNDHAANILFEEEYAKQLFGQNQNTEMAKIAKMLKTPENLWRFIQMLEIQGSPINAVRLSDLAQEAYETSSTSLRKWFSMSDEKYRLLLTSAALFSGLRSDQFFRAFDTLVHHHWKHRAPSLLSVDYCDFDVISHYFQFEESDSGESFITNVGNEEEGQMLELAWKGYRRHMEWVIPQIVDEIIGSYGNGPRFFAINLRRQLGLTLARLGTIKPDAVSHSVDTLALDNRGTVRRVASRIMAEWHRQGRDDLFEMTAQRWLGNGDEDNMAKITLCLCIRYAANYDAHNQLSPILLNLIYKLLTSPLASVRKKMDEWLPTIICNHAVLLAPILKTDWLRRRDQTVVVAKGLAQAYAYWPKETREIILDWLQDAGEAVGSTGTGNKLTHRDRVLLAACITMSNVAGVYPEVISRGMAVQEFRYLLKQESQPIVRKSLVRLILQAVLNTLLFPEEELLQVWAEQSEEERQIMFDHLQLHLPGCSFHITSGTAHGLAQLREQETSPFLRSKLLEACMAVLRQLTDADIATLQRLLCHPISQERVNAYRTVGETALAPDWPWKQNLFQLLLSLIPNESDPGAKGSAIGLAIQLVKGPTPFDAEEIVSLFQQCDFGTKITLMETLLDLLSKGQFPNPDRLLEMARQLHADSKPLQRKNLREGLHKGLAKCSVAFPQFSMEVIKVWSQDRGFAADQELGFFLAEMHLHQRAVMRGATFHFSHLGHEIPMFLKPRELTATEIALLKWMKIEQSNLRRIAIFGFLEMSKWLGINELNQLNTYVPPPAPPKDLATLQCVASESQPNTHPTVNPMQSIPSPQSTPAKVLGSLYPVDPSDNMPLGVRIKVWLLLLFQPSAKKVVWKATLRTLYLTPYHEQAQIMHTLRTWQQVNDPELAEMAKFLMRILIKK